MVDDIRRLSEKSTHGEARPNGRAPPAGLTDETRPPMRFRPPTVSGKRIDVGGHGDRPAGAGPRRLPVRWPVIATVSTGTRRYLTELPSDDSNLENQLARQASLAR